jgi:hypothetical protein
MCHTIVKNPSNISLNIQFYAKMERFDKLY